MRTAQWRVALCYLGGMVQVASTQAVTMRLPLDEYEALRAYAFVSKQSVNDVVRRAIRQLLATEGASGETYAMFDAAKGQYRVVVNEISKDLDEEAAPRRGRKRAKNG
jgi:hypothetical protein